MAGLNWRNYSSACFRSQLPGIAAWATMVFGEHAPHSNTLLRWARDGRIKPQARKIGRKWWMAPTAEYRED